MYFLVIGFIVSFVSTYFLIPLMQRIAYALNILDVPDGLVKKHVYPTPYLGGIAVYIGFFVGHLLAAGLAKFNLSIFLMVTAFLILGLIDDLLRLEWYKKFSCQILIALAYVFLENVLGDCSNNILITKFLLFIWIIIGVNAVNLVDVMDGLATVTSIAACIGLLLFSFTSGKESLVSFPLSLLGALCAFLNYNYPPAKIYLGDAGAFFIGAVLSSVTFFYYEIPFTIVGYVGLFATMAIPLLEMIMLIILRTYQKVPFYKPTPDHFYMYLIKKGLTKRQILLKVFIFACLLAINGVWINQSLNITMLMVGAALMPILMINFLVKTYMPL